MTTGDTSIIVVVPSAYLTVCEQGTTSFFQYKVYCKVCHVSLCAMVSMARLNNQRIISIYCSHMLSYTVMHLCLLHPLSTYRLFLGHPFNPFLLQTTISSSIILITDTPTLCTCKYIYIYTHIPTHVSISVPIYLYTQVSRCILFWKFVVIFFGVWFCFSVVRGHMSLLFAQILDSFSGCDQSVPIDPIVGHSCFAHCQPHTRSQTRFRGNINRAPKRQKPQKSQKLPYS